MSNLLNWRAILLLVLLPVAGCKSTYKESSVSHNQSRPMLRNDAMVYIAFPFDGVYKKEAVPESGKRTAAVLQEAFARHTRGALLARRPELMPEAIESAQRSRCQYLVFPSILRWEDRSTEWSGLRDRMELKLDLVDTLSGETLYTTVIKGRSKWMTDGGDAPQDLLETPVRHYADSLFRPFAVPSSLK